MEKLIAIVDDEPDILELVSLHLRKSGFRTKEFVNGKDFMGFISKEKPDLIILDLMLPDSDGVEICKKIRFDNVTKNIPVIMLTAKTEEIDVILGLELGADDYITKPFSPKELVARVKAVLRRTNASETHDVLRIGGILEIDPQKYLVKVNNRKINLTTTEFKILKILAEKKGWVFSRDKLLDILWGDEKFVLDRTIDVHIKNLREKLGEAGIFVKNVRGVGYKIEE